MAGALAPGARQPELGEGKLVTEKREGNPVLPFSLPGLVAEHPYVCGRGLSRETASRFEIGYHAGPGIMTGRLAIPIYDEHGRPSSPPDSGNRLCCSTTIAPRAEATVV
jgi:hypothetical protein